MKIIVCCKQVPDTETKVAVAGDGREIAAEGVAWVLNPYDEFAVEEALRITEKLGQGEVTLVSLGPARVQDALRTGLAMGAHRAVLLRDDAFEGGDALAVARVLAKAISTMEYDLILCGKQAVDDDSAQVGAALAELLGLPEIGLITKVEILEGGKEAVVLRQVDGGGEEIQVQLPAVLTAQKGLNEPRYPSLPGIMKARKKEIINLDAAALGLNPGETGRSGSGTEVLALALPDPRQPGRLVEGDAATAAVELARLLREEAKVI